MSLCTRYFWFSLEFEGCDEKVLSAFHQIASYPAIRCPEKNLRGGTDHQAQHLTGDLQALAGAQQMELRYGHLYGQCADMLAKPNFNPNIVEGARQAGMEEILLLSFPRRGKEMKR